MVKAIRTVEIALGDGKKIPKLSELPIRDVARRSLIVRRNLPAGHILKAYDIAILRPGTGIPPKYAGEVMGRKLAVAKQSASTLDWGDLM